MKDVSKIGKLNWNLAGQRIIVEVKMFHFFQVGKGLWYWSCDVILIYLEPVQVRKIPEFAW
jgi:squalene cyclase